jgi:hypothetical protein
MLYLIACMTGNADPGLVVHEWGTFTTVNIGSGGLAWWQPLLGPADLPSFVHRATIPGGKHAGALVRMETPVIYFHTAKEQSATVTVDFPQGALTEWYPKAQSTTNQLKWNIRLIPGLTTGFPDDGSEDRYYRARAAASAGVVAGDESDSLIFYRGLGYFGLDYKAAKDALLFERRGDLAAVVAGVDITKRPSVTGQWRLASEAVEEVQEKLLLKLQGSGLYEDEARAMLATWEDQWFESGLRVFYLVDRATVDSVLPLKVEPTPTAVVRTFVARAELITEEEIVAIRQILLLPTDEAKLLLQSQYGRFARVKVQSFGAMTEAELKAQADLLKLL